MPALQYARGAYKRADLPQLRVVNQYVEATPANPGDGAVLLGRPALVLDTTVGGGPVRGLISSPGVFADSLFALSGGTLYRDSLVVGGVAGERRVSMAMTLNTLLIGNDDGLYSSDGVTVAAVAFPDGAGVSSVGYIGGYAYAIRYGTRRIYFTLDPVTWDGLDYLAAEQDTGQIVGTAIVSDQIWVFCQRVTEIFTTTGDPDSPFQRVEGRLFDKGCIARDTIAKGDNTVFWVGNDRIVYRGDQSPMRVSDHGIEERLANSNPEDLSGWIFVWNGHTFYVLRTAEGTFAFDAATQEWCEFASYGRSAWRAHIGIFREGRVVAGDDETGALYSLSDDALNDNGAVIERRCTALLKPGKQAIVDTVEIDIATGMSPSYDVTAVIEARLSRDGGNTWGHWRPASMGGKGRYRSRPVWRRWGMIDETCVFEFRATDATPWRLSGVMVNDGQAGRGR